MGRPRAAISRLCAPLARFAAVLALLHAPPHARDAGPPSFLPLLARAQPGGPEDARAGAAPASLTELDLLKLRAYADAGYAGDGDAAAPGLLDGDGSGGYEVVERMLETNVAAWSFVESQLLEPNVNIGMPEISAPLKHLCNSLEVVANFYLLRSLTDKALATLERACPLVELLPAATGVPLGSLRADVAENCFIILGDLYNKHAPDLWPGVLDPDTLRGLQARRLDLLRSPFEHLRAQVDLARRPREHAGDLLDALHAIAHAYRAASPKERRSLYADALALLEAEAPAAPPAAASPLRHLVEAMRGLDEHGEAFLEDEQRRLEDALRGAGGLGPASAELRSRLSALGALADGAGVPLGAGLFSELAYDPYGPPLSDEDDYYDVGGGRRPWDDPAVLPREVSGALALLLALLVACALQQALCSADQPRRGL